jgi:hypothetical protein
MQPAMQVQGPKFKPEYYKKCEILSRRHMSQLPSKKRDVEDEEM